MPNDNPITQNEKYDWDNFARDLWYAEHPPGIPYPGDVEIIDAVVEDVPPALPSGKDDE